MCWVGDETPCTVSSIGFSRPRPPNPIVLLNPVVVGESADTDLQYEGCQVPRPLRLEVEHTAQSGQRTVTVFTEGMGRLVAHEIDHLGGHTYLDRMPAGTEPISVEEYKGTGRAWSYGR